MNPNLPLDARERVFAAASQIFEESGRQTMPTVDQVRRLAKVDMHAATAAMRPLHDRMPVILAPADWWAWLNGATAADQVQALLRPCPEAALAAYPVSTAVGSVRNDTPALIRPV